MSRFPAVIQHSMRSHTEICTTSDGVEHTGPGGVYRACRHLIAEGSDPNRKVILMRGNRICFTSRIGYLASRMWGGAEKDPASRRWRPMKDEDLPPRVRAWWDALNAT